VKKLAAILILGVMLFNGFGYRLVANYFDQKAAENFVALIEEENYEESDLVTIKTPVNLPYYANSAKFERVDGEMVIDGIVYQYVQRRVYNDSVEIKVLANQDRLHIKNAREDFYKLAQDLQKDGQEEKSLPSGKSSAKFLAFDYISFENKYDLSINLLLNNTIGSIYSDRLLSNCLPIQLPPPKTMA
jgi:hypothetical protein